MPRPVAGSGSLRIWTANLLYRVHRPDLLVQGLAAAAPDVIVLQELTPPMARYLADALTTSHPHRVLDPDPGPDGFGILSRFPMSPSGTATVAGGARFLQAARLATPFGPIGVFNVHLVSPVDARALRRGGWRGVGRLRETQAADVAERVATSAVPAIIAGDLNAWPGRPAVRALTNVAQDVWKVAGLGRGATWPRKLPVGSVPVPPLFRLDYCFVSAGLRATRARVVKEPTGSDHSPLVVDVVGAA